MDGAPDSALSGAAFLGCLHGCYIPLEHCSSFKHACKAMTVLCISHDKNNPRSAKGGDILTHGPSHAGVGSQGAGFVLQLPLHKAPVSCVYAIVQARHLTMEGMPTLQNLLDDVATQISQHDGDIGTSAATVKGENRHCMLSFSLTVWPLGQCWWLVGCEAGYALTLLGLCIEIPVGLPLMW